MKKEESYAEHQAEGKSNTSDEKSSLCPGMILEEAIPVLWSGISHFISCITQQK